METLKGPCALSHPELRPCVERKREMLSRLKDLGEAENHAPSPWAEPGWTIKPQMPMSHLGQHRSVCTVCQDMSQEIDKHAGFSRQSRA